MAAACAIPDAAASFIFLILLQLLNLNQARLWSGESAGALVFVCSACAFALAFTGTLLLLHFLLRD
jgi:hypothetical protein